MRHVHRRAVAQVRPSVWFLQTLLSCINFLLVRSSCVVYAPFFCVREEARPIDHDEHIVEVERVAGRITKLQQGTACFT